MKKLIFLAIISVSLLSARSDDTITWDWSWTQNDAVYPISGATPDMGSGTLTTDPINNLGRYTVIGVTGDFAGVPIVQVNNGSLTSSAVYGTADFIDINGDDLIFEHQYDGYIIFDYNATINGGNQYESGDLTLVQLSPVPEPSAWAGISAAMLGVVYIVRRRLTPARL